MRRLALLLLCSGCAGAAPPAPLSARGMRIVDAAGNAVILRGVNLSGFEWGAGTPWRAGGCRDARWGRRFGCYSPPPADAAGRIAAWGFDVVRLPVSWADLEPVAGGAPNETYLQDLERTIDALAARGVLVFLSMHQWGWSPAFSIPRGGDRRVVHGNGFPPWLYAAFPADHAGQQAAAREFFAGRRKVDGVPIQERLAAVWGAVARRLKGRPNVIGADLLNEPYGDRGDALVACYLTLARAVRREAPAWLLLFEPSIDHPEALDPRPLLSLARGKAVFTFHVYSGSWDAGGRSARGKPRRPAKPKLARALARAREWDVPALLGEFHLPGDRTRLDEEGSRAFLRFLRKDGPGGNGVADVSWCYWAYGRDSRPLMGPTGAGPEDRGLLSLLRAAE